MNKKTISPPTADELLDILNNQWASAKTIQKIAYVGANKAGELFNEIKKEVLNDGYKLPSNLVPMERVVKYFNININYLKKVSKQKGETVWKK